MNDIYWITRFGAIDGASFALFVVSLLVSVAFIVVITLQNYAISGYTSDNNQSGIEEYKGYIKVSKRILKYSIPCMIISCLVCIFVPNTKEALLIYGVGGTIDYLKENPTAKKLPDKCLIALEKWVDSYNQEKKKKE